MLTVGRVNDLCLCSVRYLYSLMRKQGVEGILCSIGDGLLPVLHVDDVSQPALPSVLLFNHADVHGLRSYKKSIELSFRFRI